MLLSSTSTTKKTHQVALDAEKIGFFSEKFWTCVFFFFFFFLLRSKVAVSPPAKTVVCALPRAKEGQKRGEGEGETATKTHHLRAHLLLLYI